MERTHLKISLESFQFHAGYCTPDFISVLFIGAVGIWWETDSHSDKVASSNYFSSPFHIEIAAEHVNCLILIYCWLYQVLFLKSDYGKQKMCSKKYICCLLSLFEQQISQPLINTNFNILKLVWIAKLTSPTYLRATSASSLELKYFLLGWRTKSVKCGLDH